MRNYLRIVAVAIAMLALAIPASAQFRWGIKAGVDVNSLHFSKDVINDVTSSDNRAGFTGGLMAEVNIPFLSFDASLMYTHRVNNVQSTDTELQSYNSDYLQIPINFKKKFGLPVINNLVMPYIFTGPSFAFLMSKKGVTDAFKQKAVDIAWNFGAGVELIGHLQISASYGLGINKVAEFTGQNNNTVDLGRSNCWTVTAAYLF